MQTFSQMFAYGKSIHQNNKKTFKCVWPIKLGSKIPKILKIKMSQL